MRYFKTLSRDERQKSPQAKSSTVLFQDTHTCNILKALTIFSLKAQSLKQINLYRVFLTNISKIGSYKSPLWKKEIQGKLIKLKKRRNLTFYCQPSRIKVN